MKSIFKAVVMLATSWTMVSFQASASFKSYKKELAAEGLTPIKYSVFDKKKSKEIIKRMRREAKMSRKVASGLTERDMSAKAKEIISDLLAQKTPSGLHARMFHWEEQYDSLPADAKFIVLQLATLRPFRGMLYRIRPYFEDAGTLAHSTILTTFKNLAANLRWLLDAPASAPHAVPFFNYIAQPYLEQGGKQPKMLRSEAQIQGWLFNDVRKAMATANLRMENLRLGSERIVWDNRLIYGSKSFQDGIDRFKIIGEIERQAMVASYENTISQINFTRSYYLHGAQRIAKELGHIVGIDTFWGTMRPSSREGYTLRELKKAFDKADTKFFGILDKDCRVPNADGKIVHCMEQSYDLLLSSVERLEAAWNIARDTNYKGSNDFGFNIAFAQADVPRGDINMANVSAVVRGPTTLRSAITGETMKFDIRGFYGNAKENILPVGDLKDFLPQSFDPVKKRKVTLNKKDVEYRNYFYGMPETWNVRAYKKAFLPSIAEDDQNAIMKASRIWAHSGGGMVRLVGM